MIADLFNDPRVCAHLDGIRSSIERMHWLLEAMIDGCVTSDIKMEPTRAAADLRAIARGEPLIPRQPLVERCREAHTRLHRVHQQCLEFGHHALARVTEERIARVAAYLQE